MPQGTIADHVYKTPPMFEFRITGWDVPPAQMVSCKTTLVITGFGNTVTIRSLEVPEQRVGAGPVGIIVYFTSAGTVAPAGSDNVALIGPEPEPANPVTVPDVTVAVHSKLVFSTSEVGI